MRSLNCDNWLPSAPYARSLASSSVRTWPSTFSSDSFSGLTYPVSLDSAISRNAELFA